MVNIKRIHERMSDLNLTKTQLGKNSGLTRVTIDKILSGGNINVDTLEALAKGLDVNVGFFFDNNMGESTQTQIGGSNNRLAAHDYGVNMEEHDELVRLRVEVKMLQEQILSAQKAYENLQKSYEHLQKMNDYLMSHK